MTSFSFEVGSVLALLEAELIKDEIEILLCRCTPHAVYPSKCRLAGFPGVTAQDNTNTRVSLTYKRTRLQLEKQIVFSDVACSLSHLALHRTYLPYQKYQHNPTNTLPTHRDPLAATMEL
jgi:hypothetical protein